LAVFVIVLLLTAYFLSPRLALVSIGAVPCVLARIATILYGTNTSLNIESFMGSIMCLGVSVSNSVMLVTFMGDHWRGGSHAAEAAIVGAGERVRPILMTAGAMTVGMVPMALALESGSQMQAPLGLAAIGNPLVTHHTQELLDTLGFKAKNAPPKSRIASPPQDRKCGDEDDAK
jgi:multidrug efflux pump subunit AcrB